MATPEVRLVGLGTGAGGHICAIFGSQEEEFELLLPFVREGLAEGDCVVLMIGKGKQPAFVEELRRSGIDAPARIREGQLVLVDASEAVAHGGPVDIDAMLAFVLGMLDASRAKGCARARFIADMEWAVIAFRDLSDLALHEARLDEILSTRDDLVICAYDSNLFSAGLLVDVLRTHRTVVLGGMLRENPFYVPAEQLLAEWRARKIRTV